MTNFLAQFSQFHFLRPDWFWVIIPLALFWLLKLKSVKTTQWHQVIPAHLANAMLGSNKTNTVKQKILLVPLIWLLTIFTLAGPTWQKIEKPVFQVKRASVILLDMSMSMRATDIKPNRLSKARYKAIDLANAITDGEVALVAYAGDAFTISPLTPDSRNIIALIPSLKPEFMPVQGSYPLGGLNNASKLLKQAGYLTGDIYWITDGVEKSDIADLREFAQKTPYRINIMTVGTPEGAPIKMLDNSLLKDHLGSIVIPKLNNRDLMNFSNISNGVFVNTTATDADIKTLLAASANRPTEQADTESEESQDNNSLTGDDWQEFGPYILLFILPLVLVFFRKGATILMLLILPLSFTPKKALAADEQTTEQSQKQNTSSPSWTDYALKTKDQVGAEHFNNEEYEQALTSFENTQWKGSSAYKSGDFETALSNFQQDNSAQGLYNQGNALAHLGKLDEAIKAYDESLKIDPNNENAIANKALLEQMKQQQEQQKQDGDQQDQDSEQDKSKEDNEQQGEQDSEQEQKESSEQDSSNKDSSDQKNSDQESSDSESSQSEEQSEPSDSENQETPEQQSEQQSSEQGETEQENSEASNEGEGEESQDKKPEEQMTSAQLKQQEIDEQEQQQKIEQLLRKVSDDPAILLRNKMILESRKRQQNSRLPAGATKSW
jgi:Ca-activated chloride channel family protein